MYLQNKKARPVKEPAFVLFFSGFSGPEFGTETAWSVLIADY
jgi:hypothetical protein